MDITPMMVKDLREQTGLGIMDCKKALSECDGDMEKSIEWLRKKGLKVAEKRSGRDTSQGIIDAYIHTGGKLAVLLELKCETDFVARTDEFKELARDLAMQVAAANPKWLSTEDVPEAEKQKEWEINAEQVRAEGKPEKIIPNIVEGKMRRFFETVCLLEQSFIKDPDRKVKDIIADKIGKIGENIQIGRFVRLVLGENA